MEDRLQAAQARLSDIDHEVGADMEEYGPTFNGAAMNDADRKD